jgi:UDP-glucose:(heptosyl)LPS alpha-1,3-glucosyltransferase
MSSYPKLIIANSQASKQVLESYNAISPIEIVNPTADYSGFNFNEELYHAFRKKLNIDNEFVWVMSGSYDDNKNPQLFIETAAELKKRTSNFKMLWISSGSPNSVSELIYKSFAKKMDVEDKIVWLESKDSYYEYFNCADGLLLTSKLESFSLVTLEALHLGLPIVANNCIGVNEILNNEYGAVINDATAILLCEEMMKVMGSPSSRNISIGETIAQRFNIDMIKNKWLTNLKPFIS